MKEIKEASLPAMRTDCWRIRASLFQSIIISPAKAKTSLLGSIVVLPHGGQCRRKGIARI